MLDIDKTDIVDTHALIIICCVWVLYYLSDTVCFFGNFTNKGVMMGFLWCRIEHLAKDVHC